MKNRGIWIALGLFVVAFAIYYLAVVRRPATTPNASASPQPSPIVHLSATAVSQVVIIAKGKVLTVSANAGSWTFSLCPTGQVDCPSQPADSAKASSLVQTLTSLRPDQVIYGAPEGFPAYGVDKPSTAQVDIKTSGSTDTLFVGAKSPDGASYYLRPTDGSDVFLITAATIDTGIVGLVDTPPVPAPSPSPSPSVAPSAPVGPGISPVP